MVQFSKLETLWKPLSPQASRSCKDKYKCVFFPRRNARPSLVTHVVANNCTEDQMAMLAPAASD